MGLTRTAYVSRNIIKFGGIGLIAFTIIWSITTGIVAAYKVAHPKYIPPTVRYGLLPKTVFPEKQFEKKNFALELPNDVLPEFKDQAKVYVVYRPISSFLALEDDTKTAKDFGFVSAPTEVKPGVYEFKNDTLNQTLTMNVLEGSFKLTYPYQSDQTLLNPGGVPDKAGAIEIAKSFLKAGNKLTPDLDEGENKVSYWQIDAEELKPVTSQSDANMARVDFYRKSLEEDFKVLSTDINKAPVSVLVSNSSTEGKKILEVNYKYANVNRESYSTYPVKTTEQAVADLKSGAYWPASDVAKSDVIIRQIYLAYFELVTLTNYMQPIFVFEGDDNFVAYVPAVVDEYVQR